MPIGSVSFGSGLASGIDFNAIIEAVLSAERRPLSLLQSRVDGFNRTKTAFGNLGTLLTEFQSKLQALKDGQTVGGKTTTLSVTDAPLKAQAGGVAASGTYDLEVLETAAAHRVRSAGLVDAYSPLVSDGAITIQAAGHEAITIDVSAGAGNNSLKAIADAVNAADEGVQASVIFDGTSSMLVVKSKETGTQHALSISDSTNLNLDDPANVLQAARDAQLVVDGVTINAQTNTVSDAIEGVTLTLTGKTDGPLTLTVADDIDGTKKSIKELVDAYNKVNDFFQAQYGSAEAEKSSAVASASSLRTIQRKLQGLLTESVTGVADGSISSLALLGIEVADGTGRLKFDETKFERLVDDGRYDEIRSLLLSTGSASDASVRFAGSTVATKVGTYDVTVTRAAEQAAVAGSGAVAAGGLGADETLTVTLNGNSSSIALAAGDTIDAIIAKVNAQLTASGMNAVAYSDNGALALRSRAYGASQELSVVSDRADAADSTRIGTTARTDAGVDVAGQIGGVDAVGSGQTAHRRHRVAGRGAADPDLRLAGRDRRQGRGLRLGRVQQGGARLRSSAA